MNWSTRTTFLGFLKYPLNSHNLGQTSTIRTLTLWFLFPWITSSTNFRHLLKNLYLYSLSVSSSLDGLAALQNIDIDSLYKNGQYNTLYRGVQMSNAVDRAWKHRYVVIHTKPYLPNYSLLALTVIRSLTKLILLTLVRYFRVRMFLIERLPTDSISFTFLVLTCKTALGLKYNRLEISHIE